MSMWSSSPRLCGSLYQTDAGSPKNIDFEKHIDAVCYLPDEFERMKEHSAVLMDALNTGAYPLLVTVKKGF